MAKSRKPRKLKPRKLRIPTSLPEVVLEKVALSLDNMTDLFHFSMVSKYWYHHIRSPFFWERKPASSRLLLCSINKFSDIVYLELPQKLPTSYEDMPDVTVWKKLKKLNTQRMGIDNVTEMHAVSSDDLLNWHLEGVARGKHKIYLFDIFNSSAPKHIPCLSADALVGSECFTTLHFKSFPLSHSFIIILGIWNTHATLDKQQSYLIYKSSIGNWRRISIRGARVFCSAETFTGDSIYFLNYDSSSIHKYNIDADDWSSTRVSLEQNQDWVGEEDMCLICVKGKLMLVEAQMDRVQVWRAVEKAGTYIFTKISSHECCHKIEEADFKYSVDHEFLQVEIWYGRRDEPEKSVRELTVYRPSSNTWHYIDRPPNFEAQKCRYFLSETKWMFLKLLAQ